MDDLLSQCLRHLALVMTEDQKQILAEAIQKALEIIERNLMAQVDFKFDEHFDGADKVSDAAEKFTEEQIKEIAREEFKEAIRDGEITVSIEA